GKVAPLVIARTIMGMSEGPVLPIAQATIRKESTPGRRGVNAGIVQGSAQLIGATLTPLFATFLAVKFSWQVSFFVMSVPGIIMVIIFWLFMKYDKTYDKKNKEKKRGKLGRVHQSIEREKYLAMCHYFHILYDLVVCVYNVCTDLSCGSRLYTVTNECHHGRCWTWIFYMDGS